MDTPDDSSLQPANSLYLSAAGKNLLEAAESAALQPYDDQTGEPTSVWVRGATIGYGHLITQNEWSTYQNGFTQDDADALLDHDLAQTVATVRNSISAEVSQNQFDAMVILCFNIGPGNFTTSSVHTLVNNPNAKTAYDSLQDAWMAWTQSQGHQMAGLVKRRQCEWAVYSQGVYNPW